jgi:hypothetical protein
VNESTQGQVDAVQVIDALTFEIAALTRRAVVAEMRVAALEAEKAGTEEKKK